MNIGTVLDGKFVALRRWGTGQFSDVFQGTIVGDDPRPIAIKVLKEPIDDDIFRETYEREVQALRTLRHKNIVQLIHAGVTNDRNPYLVTEFLSVPLKPFGKWDLAIIEIAESILAALQQGLAAGVIHRDIKPQHLLREAADGELKGHRLWHRQYPSSNRDWSYIGGPLHPPAMRAKTKCRANEPAPNSTFMQLVFHSVGTRLRRLDKKWVPS